MILSNLSTATEERYSIGGVIEIIIIRNPISNMIEISQWKMVLFAKYFVNNLVNYGEAGDLRRHLTRYDVTVMVDLMQIVLSIYRRKLCHILKTKSNYTCSCAYIWVRSTVIWSIVQRRKINKNINWTLYMIYSFMLGTILLSYALRQGFVNTIT